MKDNIMEERSKNFENKNINQLKFNCINSNGISLRK